MKLPNEIEQLDDNSKIIFICFLTMRIVHELFKERRKKDDNSHMVNS